MDKVAGFLEIDRRDDTHEIVISHPAFKSDDNGLIHIMLLPRHARYLANLLIENATYAEAEIFGMAPRSRRYRRSDRPGSNVINCLQIAAPSKSDPHSQR
jgi:hypothetical protein